MNHMRHLHSQVKRLLLAETKLSEDQRKHHQWQFLSRIGAHDYIVGKGGANTMFLIIDNDSENRKLFTPAEMLDFLAKEATRLSAQKFVYYTLAKSPTKTKGRYDTVDEALKQKAPEGIYICGVDAKNNMVRLWKRMPSLAGLSWAAFER